MHEITMQDAEHVGGSGLILNYLITKAVEWVGSQALQGNIDYSSIAEQQGSYYNTVGA